ncbi:MAG: hypothetical protein M5T61_06530 [Acidimicrobiia bacterium]|nr:hypothetical protein [Acidimicrobiia bacterium]
MLISVVLAAVVSTACSGNDTEGDSDSDQSVEDPAELAEFEGMTVVADVVDADAVLRCERIGYPCTWEEAREGASADSFAMLEEVRAAMIEVEEPSDQIELAARRLVDDDRVVEVMPDLHGFTGVMFRLDGAPPVFLDTELAGTVADGSERERVELSVPVVADGESGSTTGGGLGNVRPRRFHPAGGPLKPKRASVIDPYSTYDRDCTSVSLKPSAVLDFEFPIKFAECRKTGDGATEGDAVAAIFESHPSYAGRVKHLRDSSVTPYGALAAFSSADSVHLVTHGSSNCRGALDEALRPIDYDPDACYTAIALGPLSDVDKRAMRTGKLNAPAGSSFSNTRWWATGDFLGMAAKSDSIVYASNCTSADGQLASADVAGFVGWHSYARVSSAVDAAIEFWRLMVVEGVEFDLAYSQLQVAGLHRSKYTNAMEYRGARATATLVAGGRNPRARDVIQMRLEDAELSGGKSVKIVGTPGDGVNDAVEGVKFFVEGVEHGTENVTKIQLYIDGKKAGKPIKVSEGVETTPKKAWSEWLVEPDEIALPFDVTLRDLDPDTRRGYRWEARVYVRKSRYSAHEADPIYFGADLRVEGEVAFFEDLGEAVEPTGAFLSENLVWVEFPTDGGAIAGAFDATVDAAFGSGNWHADLTGTFDPASGSISGQAVATAFGGGAGVFAGDSASGPFTAQFDWGSGTLSGTMLDGSQQMPFTATLG